MKLEWHEWNEKILEGKSHPSTFVRSPGGFHSGTKDKMKKKEKRETLDYQYLVYN